MLDITIVRVMRDALLRVSEAAELLWGDIEEEEDGTGRLLIRRSKTDPEGEGAVAFLSVPTMDSLRAIRAGEPGRWQDIRAERGLYKQANQAGCVRGRTRARGSAATRRVWEWRGTWRAPGLRSRG